MIIRNASRQWNYQNDRHMVDPRTHQPFHGLLRTHSFEIDGSGKKKQSNMMQDTDSNPSLDSSFISVSSAAKRDLLPKRRCLPWVTNQLCRVMARRKDDRRQRSWREKSGTFLSPPRNSFQPSLQFLSQFSLLLQSQTGSSSETFVKSYNESRKISLFSLIAID